MICGCEMKHAELAMRKSRLTQPVFETLLVDKTVSSFAFAWWHQTEGCKKLSTWNLQINRSKTYESSSSFIRQIRQIIEGFSNEGGLTYSDSLDKVADSSISFVIAKLWEFSPANSSKRVTHSLIKYSLNSKMNAFV